MQIANCQFAICNFPFTTNPPVILQRALEDRKAPLAPKVLLVPEAAQAIVGTRLDVAAQQRLEAAARAACRPIDDKRGTTEFRVDVAAVLTRRAALIALDRARTS